MKERISSVVFVVAVMCLAGFAGSPAEARLYPPCQGITWQKDTVGSIDSITYQVVDPISGQAVSETWTADYGDQRIIETAQLDGGILSWVSKYKYSEDYDYTFQVHLRIYDPGRGGWRADQWTLSSAVNFAGYHKSIGQHQVKHGVVAWTAQRKLADGRLEHKVVTATYDPTFGSWVLNEHTWQVPWNSLESPEVLRVKNGVVAWPMNKAISGKCSDECDVRIFFSTYDYELHQWVSENSLEAWCDYNSFDTDMSFNWIDIPDDLALVRFEVDWNLGLGATQAHRPYDPYHHKWRYHDVGWEEISRAFFLAQPESAIVPKWVWFWDCSTGLDGVSQPSNWSWEVVPGGGTKIDRSPTYFFSNPAGYYATETIYHESYSPKYYTAMFNAMPPATTGNISINNDDAYTISANVTLSLNYGPTATEMRFLQSPGLLVWGNWEPVSPGKALTLSTLHAAGQTPDGPHTVYVQYRDHYGTESAVSQDSITLVTKPPAGTLTLNNGDAATHSPTVTATWSAASSYAMQMSYCYYNTGDTFYPWTSWEPYQPTTETFQFSSDLGKKTVMVRFKDVAGNITQVEAGIYLIPPEEADLALSMADSPDPVSAGSNLAYTLSVNNTGPDDATSVILRSSLPPGVALVSATASQGSCQEVRGRVLCGLGTIARRSSATATVVVTPAALGTITYTAIVNSATTDPDPGNNTATESTLVNGPSMPDLVVTSLSDPPLSTLPGWNFPVTDTVTNQGSGSAGASTTRYYFSVDTTKGAGDILLEGSRAVDALSPGESSTGSTNYTIPASTPAGSYYLLACADDLGAVSESVEINNCRASAGKVQVAGGLPDLIETAVSTSTSTVSPGGTFEVTDTVMNQGGGLAGSSTTSYYLSLDTTKGPGDMLIGSRSVGALLPMGGLQGTVIVTVPTYITAGYYYLLACADDLGVVSEADESNNCRASTGKVQVPDGLPDLIETAVSTSTSTVYPGGTFEVTDTMVNLGTGLAGSTTTRYYLSLDTVKSPGDVLLGSRSVGAILPLGGLQGTVTLTVPASTATGSYYLLACADDLGALSESDKTNNCRASAGKVQVAGGLPDLLVTAVSTLTSTVCPGETFEVTDTVMNQGGGMAGSSTTSYYLSLDTTRSPGDMLIGSRSVGALLPMRGLQGTVTVTVPTDATAGYYYLLACADDLGDVSEADESNNCRAFPIWVILERIFLPLILRGS